ncbi:MAG: hypothetical protein ACLQLH_03440 [Terracidiphilus sp.]
MPTAQAVPQEDVYLRAYARRLWEQKEEELARAKAIERPASDEETAATNQRVRLATADELTWLRCHTETFNPHWKEEGRANPYEPFPDKPYFQTLFDYLNSPGKVKAIEKSRDLMITWAIMGHFTLEAMKVHEREIIVQTMEKEKAEQCIDYAKCLYRRQPQWLKDAFPLAKPLNRMAANEFSLANGSVIWGIPGGAGKLRSYHPWGYFNDESAFQPEAGLCFDEALSACQKVVLNSTAWPSWYFDWMNDSEGKA